tara:strand:- start:555 stop:923 length:369 start_codon:yes stop_codon:yes gene_type:complete
MKTYQYLNAENTIVAVFDEDGISRGSCLASSLPEGTEIEPYIPPPPVVPSVITMRQARLALLMADRLSEVNAAVNQAGEAAQIEWEFATEVHRNWPLVAALQSGLGLTDDDLDALFTLGATL